LRCSSRLNSVLYFTIIGGVFIAWLILVLLFTPHIPYHVEGPIDPRSEHFVHLLESTCNTELNTRNRVEILTNGAAFYPAMLEAIRRAEETINLECYIFRKGEIATRFVEALSERARAGVKVTIVFDAIGTLGSFHWAATPLRAAGCSVQPYQRVRWYALARLNNRTHRELLVVDGRVAFAGGAGVADWWLKPTRRKRVWRDTMARFEGPIVSHIQGVFAENWLETCGEILTSELTYRPCAVTGTSAAFAIKSSPADRATVSRVLFQTLVESATERISISTPYFLPDKAFRRAFVRTARRGVEVTVVVPGPDTDQRWVRLASRRMYGELLKTGVRIYEYGGGMTHVKALLVDDLWSVIGTTNVDNRSFEHNDEVNIAIRDAAVTARLTSDFVCDRDGSTQITLEQWKHRPLWEKLVGTVAWILERQQ
jgi:cardiolipin synthase A/B